MIADLHSLNPALERELVARCELGSVPLPVVTARVDRFIAENGKGPYPDME
jgi:hypothetical protein